MITEMLGAGGALGTFGVAVIVFGFAPGMVLALVTRLIPDNDRRRELQAELYEVPRWERPFWVAQQFEVALRIGLAPRISWAWGRHIWHRSRVECGLELHRQWPETFDVPGDDEKELIVPGDLVKLMWAVARFPGERMWVRVIRRDGDRLSGTLENLPVYVFMDHGEQVKFQIDDIIDFEYVDEREDDEANNTPAIRSGG